VPKIPRRVALDTAELAGSIALCDSTTGTPNWVYVIGFAVFVVMLAVVLLHLGGTSVGYWPHRRC
jgi:hypothetical protein